MDLVETNEPRLISFNFYLDEPGNSVSCVQVHPDAASMEFHMTVVAQHIRGAFDHLERTVSEQVYGTPSEVLTEKLREYPDPDTALTLAPIHEAGFTRSNAR